jgi:outer membrane autotransporter protein
MSGIHRRIVRCMPLIVLAGVTAAEVAAQPTALGETGNEIQQPIGAAMQAIYVRFAQATGGDPDLLADPGQRDLFLRCSELVETAEFLNSGSWVPQGERIEEITTVAELAAALQQVGVEELSALGMNAAETSRLRGTLHRLAGMRRAAAAAPPERGEFAAAGRWALCFDGTLGFGSQDATTREDRFDYNVPALALGMDYRLGMNAIIGGVIGYESFDADFDNNQSTVAGGDLEADLFSLSVYSSYSRARFYLDGAITLGWDDYRLTRRIVYPRVVRAAESSTAGDEYDLLATLGYSGHLDRLQYAPFVRVMNRGLGIDGYTESAASGLDLVVMDQEIDSLVLILGSQFFWSSRLDGGGVVPRFEVEWYHEFQNASRLITARFANDPFGAPFSVPTDDPDTDYFQVAAGLTRAWSAAHGYVNFGAALGLDGVTGYLLTGGVRFAL